MARSRSRSKGASSQFEPPAPSSAPPSPWQAANGWTLLFYPALLEQIEKLIAAIDAERPPLGAAAPLSANRKLLAQIRRSIFDRIPADPNAAIFQQGITLGKERRHWFRDKFGNGRFRLFFRFSTRARIIAYAWVNDEDTRRTYGAKTDAYAVFRRMLAQGNPPESWEALLAAYQDPQILQRADALLGGERSRQALLGSRARPTRRPRPDTTLAPSQEASGARARGRVRRVPSLRAPAGGRTAPAAP